MTQKLLSIVWDVSPDVFNLLGREVRWYGILWATALLIGFLIFKKIMKREGLGEKALDSIALNITIWLIVGARLGHCLFYEPAAYLADPISILYVWQGGLASHGAALGILFGLWIFSRKNKLPYIWGLDRIGLAVTIGGAAVRLGNLMNSEIYGHVTDLPWGFIFVRDGQTLPMHPTQLYEALAYLVLFGILWWMYFKKDLARRMPGIMTGVFLIGLFLARFLIEFVKNPQESFEESMALNMGQLLSIPFILLGVGVLIWGLRRARQPQTTAKR